MNRLCIARRGLSTLTGLLLILILPGCGSDSDSIKPKPKPEAEISMSVECNSGLIDLTVRNSGGAMEEPSRFIASFHDGAIDTLLLSVGAGDSAKCLVSNIHGDVTVRNEELGLEEATGDCLADYFEGLFASVNLSAYVPSPLTQIDLEVCTYTVDLNNLDYDHATFQLIRTDDGLTLQYVYSGITANISAPAPGWWCPDITGNIAISSILVETRINIGEGDDPEITLGSTTAAVDGLQVNINGNFGFLVEWLTTWLQNSFTGTLEDAIATAISNAVGGSDLSDLVIVRSGCAQ